MFSPFFKWGDLRSEEASEEVADEAANTVDGEDIERIVNVEKVLDLGGEVTGDGTNNTEDDSRPGWDESSCWSDGNETSDGTGAESDSGPLAVESVIHEGPCDTTGGSCSVCDEAGHDGADVGSESGAAVESEPANPQEHRAEDDVSNVVRTVWESRSRAVSRALAEHDRVREGSSTRRDMDGSSASEVETTHEEGPAVGVPSPASDRVVNYSRPDENENQTW